MDSEPEYAGLKVLTHEAVSDGEILLIPPCPDPTAPDSEWDAWKRGLGRITNLS